MPNHKIPIPYHGNGAVMTCPYCLSDGIIDFIRDYVKCWDCGQTIPWKNVGYIKTEKK